MHFEWFPEHLSLLQMIQSTRKIANATGARSYYEWRGHRDFVNPGNKVISKLVFDKHLITALKGIKSLSKDEEKVHSSPTAAAAAAAAALKKNIFAYFSSWRIIQTMSLLQTPLKKKKSPRQKRRLSSNQN